MGSRRRWRSAIAFLALLSICAVLLLYVQCRRKYTQLQEGMNLNEVRKTLGNPYRTEEVDSTSPITLQNVELLNKFPHLTLLIYKCRMGDDLFVYFDPNGTLVLRERAIYIEHN